MGSIDGGGEHKVQMFDSNWKRFIRLDRVRCVYYIHVVFVSRYAFIKYGNVTETMWHNVYILNNANRRQPNVTMNSHTFFPIMEPTTCESWRISTLFLVYAFFITSSALPYRGNFTFSLLFFQSALNLISCEEEKKRIEVEKRTLKKWQRKTKQKIIFVSIVDSRVLCDKWVARAEIFIYSFAWPKIVSKWMTQVDKLD